MSLKPGDRVRHMFCMGPASNGVVVDTSDTPPVGWNDPNAFAGYRFLQIRTAAGTLWVIADNWEKLKEPTGMPPWKH